MDVKKATQEGYRTELFMPLMKGKEGKYMAVLSDNSTDRDDEKLSKGCVEKLGQDNGYVAALCNHTNDVFMLVAEWTNRGIREVDGYTALIAEPKFYLSNPRAQEIKGMLDEGAKIGVSIGAIVKDYDEVDGMRVFTELELLEASFVAIPSNKHGRAMAVAKSFNNKKTEEKMEKEFTKKDLDSAIEKKTEELNVDFKKQLESKEVEITKLKKDAEEATEAKEEAETKTEEAEAKVEEAETKTEEAEAKVEESEKKLKETNKTALEKQKFADEGTDADKAIDIEKELKDGKLPIMKG